MPTMKDSWISYKTAMNKMEAEINWLLETQKEVSSKDFNESLYSSDELVAVEVLLQNRRVKKFLNLFN